MIAKYRWNFIYVEGFFLGSYFLSFFNHKIECKHLSCSFMNLLLPVLKESVSRTPESWSGLSSLKIKSNLVFSDILGFPLFWLWLLYQVRTSYHQWKVVSSCNSSWKWQISFLLNKTVKKNLTETSPYSTNKHNFMMFTNTCTEVSKSSNKYDFKM